MSSTLFRRCVLAAVVAFAVARPAHGQGYRLRLDTRAQTASWRGVALDSIPVADTAIAALGQGTMTRQGFAATCSGTSPYCTFWRPGRIARAAPVSTTADLTLWSLAGVSVTGLSIHATARATRDLDDASAWPGSNPGVQLLEGYARYARELGSVGALTGQLGRQTVMTRLGVTGFDGARVALHNATSTLEADGYAGWGLARGIALPVTSPALNPLDEFRPQRRQLVAGGGAGWMTSRFDLRATYLREVDPSVDFFVSERAGADVVVRPLSGWSLTGGADYDIATGLWGSAESTLRYAPAGARVDATLGVQRYRPHFDLWTIWGAFSPVPYRSVQGSVSFAPFPHLRVRARGQRYEFENADVSTPLATYETAGWRFAWGATYALGRFVLDGGYHAEFGPGAAARGFEGALTTRARDSLLLTLYASTLDRPLEFRFGDASLNMYGAGAEYRPTSRLRLQIDANGYAERRERPDAGSFDWNQARVSARVVLLLGDGADLGGLPAAVQRMPGGRERR